MSRIRMSSRQKPSPVRRIIIFSSLGLCIAFGIFFIAGNFGTSEKAHAALGMHGAKTVSSTDAILNEYTTLTSNASAGSNSIAVASSSMNANGRFSGNLTAGELLMIVQMQGATIGTTNASSYGAVSAYNNCGNFEFVEVLSITNATNIKLANALSRSYTSSGATQVIRVPRYSSFTVNAGASVTCPAWNGSTGGVLAIECNGTTTINGIIDVSSKGFRGGAEEWNTSTPGDHTNWRSTLDVDGAEKGESIAGPASSLSNGRYGRGAPANGGGGGNSHNAGGGGGANGGSLAAWNGKGNPDNPNANWTTAWNLEAASFATNTSSGGGRGGYSWSSNMVNPITNGPTNAAWGGDNRYNVGGYGGRPNTYAAGKLFMGGGGGAGDANNNVGQPGGDGGGIIYLLSGRNVTGTGVLKANGESVPLSSGIPGDAAGGGGGGGTIFIFSNSGTVSGVTLNANGGAGGSQSLNNGGEAEGNGGGGGGGYISVSNPVAGLTRTVTGGTYGITNAPPMANFTANGATAGSPGTSVNNPANPYSTPTPLPIELKSFNVNPVGNKVVVSWVTSSEINNSFFSVKRSADGQHFEDLIHIPGAGNSTSDIFYTWTDEHPLNGKSYYKLMQTDYDGRFEEFDPVLVRMEPEQTQVMVMPEVFPSPFSQHISIAYRDNPDPSTQIDLVNSAGQIVRSLKDLGNNRHLQLEGLDNLPPGIYFMHVKSEKNSGSIKLIKDH